MSDKNRVVFRKLLIFPLVLCILFSFSYTIYALEDAAQNNVEISKNNAINTEALQELPVVFSAGFLIDSWQKQAQPCDTTLSTLEITNLADYTDTYALSAFSGNKYFDESWVAVSEQEFTLAPQQTKELAIFITPPCEIYGKLDVNLNFKSAATELEASVLLQTIIARNYTYTLDAGKYEVEKQIINQTTEDVSVFKSSNKRYNICDGKKTLVPIKLTNKVELGNVYNLEIEAKGAKDFANLAHKGIALYGNSAGIVDLGLEPELGKAGNYTIAVKSVSERGGLFQEDKIKVFIRECSKLGIDILKEKDKLCNYNAKSYEVKITNKGEFSESVVLNAKGDCASLSKNNLIILPKNNAIVNLLIDEKCKLTGKNRVTVTAELLNNSKVQASDNLELEFVDVEKCYKTEIENGKRQIIGTENGSKTEVKIQNLGTETVDYTVSLDVKPRILPWLTSRKDFVTPDLKAFKLTPNKTQVLTLNFDLDNVVPGRYGIKIKTTANNKVLFSRNILAIVGKDKFISFVWYYKYYSLAALIILLILFYTLITSIIESLRVYVEEEFGIVDAGKEMTIRTNKDLSPQELKITAKQQLLDAKIRIEKLSNNKTKDTADLIYECFEIAVENTIAYNLKSAVLKFKVAKQWIEKNNLLHNDIALKALSGDNWQELKAKKTGIDAQNVYYRAEINDFGLFAITPNTEYYKQKADDGKQKELEERKHLAEEAKNAREEESKKKQETKAEVREKAEKVQKFANKKSKKIIKGKPVSLLEKFAKFAGVLILLLLIILGVLNGYIYYIAGGVIAAGLIIGILNATEYYRSDEYKQKRKLLEKQRLKEEREEAKKRAEEERKEAQMQAEEERKAREQEKAEAEKVRKEEQERKRQEAEQKRRELEQKKKEEKQRKLEERNKLLEEARQKLGQERIAKAQIRAEARLTKKQKKEKASYTEYLVIALILLVLLIGVIYFASPKLKEQLKSTIENFNRTIALPEIKLINKTLVTAAQPKLEEPKITIIKQESKELLKSDADNKTTKTPEELSETEKTDQLKLEQEKKLAEIKIVTELKMQQEEKRLDEERKKFEEQKLKQEAENKKAEEQKKIEEEKKKQEQEKKLQEELAQKQQQEFLKKTLEESLEGAIVTQEAKEEMPSLISIFNLKEYGNKLAAALVKYLDYIAFGAGLLLVIIVVVNIFRASKTGKKTEKVVTQKKGKKKNLGQRLGKKVVDFFFEEE